MAELPALPYYCPKMKSGFLNEAACAKNLGRAKALSERFAYLGPLQHCLECQGKELQINGVVGGKEIQAKAVDIRSDWGNPQARRLKDMQASVVPIAEQQAPEPAAAKAKHFCKNHPEVAAHLTKGGWSMGLCLECVKSRAAKNSRNRKGKETPEVDYKVKEQKGGKLSSYADNSHNMASNVEAAHCKLVVAPSKIPDRGPAVKTVAPEHPCPRHPSVERHRDKHEKLLPFCKECYVARSKDRLVPGQGMRGGNIVLAFPDKHLDLRDWVMAQAEEQERTPAAQVIYLLKLARRQVEGDSNVEKA
jgi:hypothetical protein